MDPILKIMLYIRNNWGLTGSGVSITDLAFSTGWYDESVVFPQITVTPAPGGGYMPMETGPAPTYLFEDFVLINIWVRPDTDSNKSIGSAKNKIYVLRREVERILRSGSQLATGYGEEQYLMLRRWRRLDEILNQRPVIFRFQLELSDNYFREIYENLI